MSENAAKYQANLTEAGCAKLLKRDYWDATPLLAGQDYVAKEEGGKDWLPFPDLPSLRKIRHTWMVVRNERPKNPSFHGAPMPKRKHGNEERNALITMAYFHPFTLHEDVADENVPHVRHLRTSSEYGGDIARPTLGLSPVNLSHLIIYLTDNASSCK